MDYWEFALKEEEAKKTQEMLEDISYRYDRLLYLAEARQVMADAFELIDHMRKMDGNLLSSDYFEFEDSRKDLIYLMNQLSAIAKVYGSATPEFYGEKILEYCDRQLGVDFTDKVVDDTQSEIRRFGYYYRELIQPRMISSLDALIDPRYN